MSGWHRYWHEFEIERSRIAVLRFGMLGLLAWDLWTTFLGHAARYGAGDFNVTQARWLDPLAPLPTPAIVSVGWLLAGFLAARAALGVAQKVSTVGAAVIYIAFYMWGQADSYQHHYFICLLLGVLAFLPDQPPTSEDGRMIRHWTMRAFYVQLTFLYLWTAVTKTDPVWLSGATLDQIVSKPALRADVLALGAKFGLSEQSVFPFMAVSVMLGQYFAATIIQIRKFWWVGMLVIPWFHIFVEFIEFDIEYFSYYMIALLTVLLSPPSFWRWAERTAAALRARVAPLRAKLGGPEEPGVALRAAISVLAGAGAGAIAAQIHIEGTAWLAGLTGVATAAGVWFMKAGRSITWSTGVQLGLVGVMLFSVRATDAEYDLYRLWGGDLKRRGDAAGAIEMYQKANAVTDGPARFYQLGQLLEREGRADEALSAYETSRTRQEAALAEELRAVHQATTDAERRFDVGDRHLRLISRCDRLAQAYRRVGRTDDAAEAERCASRHATDAVDAFQAGLKFQPQSGRGHRGLRDARRRASRR